MTNPIIEYNSKRYGTLKAWRLSDDLPVNQLTGEFIREHHPQAIIHLDDAEQLVDGKYVKKSGTNEIWTGTITGFTADGELARLGNSRSAWAVRLLEKIDRHSPRGESP